MHCCNATNVLIELTVPDFILKSSARLARPIEYSYRLHQTGQGFHEPH